MSKGKILVVEDEIIIAEDIKSALTKNGYLVMALLATGEETLHFLKTNSPDLVLMDICLAGKIDGIKTAEVIKQEYGYPVVYLTAYSNEETVGKAKLTEPFGFIVKPFDRKDLTCCIEMAIYKHQRSLETTDKKHPDVKEKAESESLSLNKDFSYHRGNKSLFYGTKLLTLTKKESRFIHLLVENRGFTVPMGKVDSYVWNGIGTMENTMRVFLWRLRSKVGKELVKTVTGVGYRIDK